MGLPRSIHILCLGTFVNRAGAFLVPFLTTYLTGVLDLTEQFAATAVAAFGVGWFFASIGGGQLADVIGRKVVMCFSLFGAAGILLVFGYLRAPWAILTALFLFGLVAEMYRPAASAMIADLTRPEQRAHAFSLMYVAINLGFAAAAVAGGVLSEYSFQLLFFGDAGTAALYGLIILTTIRETLGGIPVDRPGGAGEEQAPAGEFLKPPRVSLAAAAVHILRDRVFLACWVGSLCMSVVYAQAFSMFPIYLMRLGYSSSDYGWIISINGLLIVALQLPATAWAAQYHRGTMVVISAVIVAVGFGMFGMVTAAWLFGVAVAVWTVGEIINAPLIHAIVGDLAPANLRARYMGALANCFSLSLIAGVPAGGWVLNHYGGVTLWAVCTAVALIGALAYATAWRKLAVQPR